MSEDKYTSQVEYAVVPVSRLRELSPHSDQQVIAAQENITPDMIDALEDMIKRARESNSRGVAALQSKAAAW